MARYWRAPTGVLLCCAVGSHEPSGRHCIDRRARRAYGCASDRSPPATQSCQEMTRGPSDRFHVKHLWAAVWVMDANAPQMTARAARVARTSKYPHPAHPLQQISYAQSVLPQSRRRPDLSGLAASLGSVRSAILLLRKQAEVSRET